MESEILNQILSELRDLKQGQSKLEAGQAKLEAGQAKLEEDLCILKASVLRIELVEVPKIQTALDGLVSNTDKLYDHERRITKLETA